MLTLQTFHSAAAMGSDSTKSRVLIVGSTGYIGEYIARASLQQGFPTYLLVRPDLGKDVKKVHKVIALRKAGAQTIVGSLDDHESLVNALQQVDVVISSVGESMFPHQTKLIKAIKQAGNIKRFLPSEFGMDPDKLCDAMKPGDAIFVEKRKIRRAIEEAGIPYTYVSANCFAGYFLTGFSQPELFMPPRDKVFITGDGNKKVVWVDEEDVGTYIMKTVDDPRTENKTVYIRPPANILSQMEVVEMWEKKINKKLFKIHLSLEILLSKMDGSPMYIQVAIAHLYQIFIRGDLYFDLGKNELDTAELYPDVPYTTVDSYLDLLV